MLPTIPPELCKVPSPIIALYCNTPRIQEAGDAAGQGLRDAATEAFEQGVIKPMANLALDAIRSLVGVFVTLFVTFTSFDLRAQGALTLYGVTIAIGWLISVVLVVAQMMRTMVQGRPVPLIQAGAGLTITAFVGGAGVGLTALAMEGANVVTKIIFDQMSADGQPMDQQGIQEQILTLMSLTNNAVGAVPSIFVQWQLSILVILVLIIQIVVVLLRNATLPLLALLLPIAASGMVGGGATRQWMPKIITAGAAIIVYQPAVALIITAATRQWSAARDAHGLVYGLVMLVLSLIAMPALLRVFAPLGVVAGGGGSGGGMTRALTDLAMMAGRSGSRDDGGVEAAGGDVEQIQPTSAGQFAQQREADTSAPAEGSATTPADPAAGSAVPADLPVSGDAPSATPPPTAEEPAATTAEAAPSTPQPDTASAPLTSATTTAAETPGTAATTATAGPGGAVVYFAAEAADHGLHVVEQHVGAAGEAATPHPVDQHPAPASDSGDGGFHDRS
ncbi:hypothetical protein [Nonomuraea maheshkhaliensis]|uniref:hypothetical protein n=1 Tax=Nonomuraea maheshkhaliensis TaxID=419590 RepID=UPI0031F7B8A4